ncbi:MAG: PQQ-dependent sugar dehydrogenase [Armatimonadota bacterium]
MPNPSPFALLSLFAFGAIPGAGDPPRTGGDAFSDWRGDAPGVRRKITVKDLPQPYASPSVDNGPRIVPRPDGAWPKAPEGFVVTLFARDLRNPRVVRTAPNGDLFIAESGPGRIRILRDADRDGRPEVDRVFASGLNLPFGIAFRTDDTGRSWVYVAETNRVVRFAHGDGEPTANAEPEVVVADVPGFGRLRGGGHWTRDIDFSKDGKTLFVSVGSISNVDDPEVNRLEERRATILAYDADGRNERIHASGIRNPVGLAVDPRTGALWTSVNERDGLGDHLVPDYITKVVPGGFYGWPWFYLGGNQDPRHAGKKPELRSKVIVPDVLLQSHSASLDLVFYSADRFPKRFRGNLFACEHGSWNRARRTGYKVVHVPLRRGKATGEYEDFLTGFVVDDQSVWGRPVGATVGGDGALYIADDGSNSIWRVEWVGEGKVQKTPSSPATPR